jgi:hypothetical protein
MQSRLQIDVRTKFPEGITLVLISFDFGWNLLIWEREDGSRIGLKEHFAEGGAPAFVRLVTLQTTKQRNG